MWIAVRSSFLAAQIGVLGEGNMRACRSVQRPHAGGRSSDPAGLVPSPSSVPEGANLPLAQVVHDNRVIVVRRRRQHWIVLRQ
jgi:hypothetical protein